MLHPILKREVTYLFMIICLLNLLYLFQRPHRNICFFKCDFQSKRALNEKFLAGEFFSRDWLVLFFMWTEGKIEKKMAHFTPSNCLKSFKNALNSFWYYLWMYHRLRELKNIDFSVYCYWSRSFLCNTLHLLNKCTYCNYKRY